MLSDGTVDTEWTPASIDDIVYPSERTPVIAPHRVARQGGPLAVFSDDVWDLEALELDASRRATPLRFSGWASGFKEFAKHVAYALINHGNPRELVEENGSNYAEWPAANSIKQVLNSLKAHVDWLTGGAPELGNGPSVAVPADLDAEHLVSLRRWVETHAVEPRATNKKLEVIVRAWFLSPWLPEHVRWPEPDWLGTNWRRHRGAESDGGQTRRIPQEVMAPLLEWATAFVTHFADDIFSAHEHYQQRVAGPELGPRGATAALLRSYLEGGIPLPVDPTQPGRISWQAVRYLSPVPVRHLAETYQRSFRGQLAIGGVDPKLEIRPSARFHGAQWLPYFLVHDVTPRLGVEDGSSVLVGHLRTACLIVSAYLTGARPEEVLSFSNDSARDPVLQPDGTKLHLVDGVSWKGRRSRGSGAPVVPNSATWATVPVTITALRVAEKVNRILGRSGGALFVSEGTRANPDLATKWIRSFAAFVNTRLAPHTVDPEVFAIPEVEEPLTLRRFRRTLAWFISNRPNGEVTTAIQYQHVSDRLVSGYAGTKDSGMRDLLLEEDWRHRRQTIESLAEMLRSGGEVSGPAASRARTVALGMPRFLTAADEKRLRRDKDLVIYDNPAAVALCVYDETRAMCRKQKRTGGRSAPTLLQCVDGCPNCARTERQIDQLESEAARLRRNASLSPRPIAQSLIDRAVRNERIIDDARQARKGKRYE